MSRTNTASTALYVEPELQATIYLGWYMTLALFFMHQSMALAEDGSIDLFLFGLFVSFALFGCEPSYRYRTPT